MSDIEKVHCSNCTRTTSHDLLYKTTTTEEQKNYIGYDNEAYLSAYGCNYFIYECQGCHNVVMKKMLWSTEIFPDEYCESYVSWYPSLASRQIPIWHNRLAEQEKELLQEIFQAVHADNKSLALMGLRAILDMYIVRKIGDKGSFKDKLDMLKTKGFLSEKQKDTLDSVIEAGNAAAHRGFRPSSDMLILVLDIVVTLLHQDILDEDILEMKKNVPKRTKA